MIELIGNLQQFGLSSLLDPVFLFLLIVLFVLGRVVGWLSRGRNIWKLLALAYFGIFLFRPLQDAGIILGGVFILGVASMYGALLREIFHGAGSFWDVLWPFGFGNGSESPTQGFRSTQSGPGAPRPPRVSQTAPDRHRQAENIPHVSSEENSVRRDAPPRARSERVSFSQDASREAHIAALGLDPRRTYAIGELREAWRRLAFETHPSRGGDADAFRKVKDAWDYLSREAQNGDIE